MGVAQKIYRVDESSMSASAEAQERLSSARYRDLAFAVKRRIGDGYSADDVDMLVTIIVQTVSEGQRLSKPLLSEKLRSFGRSRQKSEDLASALIG